MDHVTSIGIPWFIIKSCSVWSITKSSLASNSLSKSFRTDRYHGCDVHKGVIISTLATCLFTWPNKPAIKYHRGLRLVLIEYILVLLDLAFNCKILVAVLLVWKQAILSLGDPSGVWFDWISGDLASNCSNPSSILIPGLLLHCPYLAVALPVERCFSVYTSPILLEQTGK